MRITGGALRSRTLIAPKGDATRPTSDRVREALFAILGSERTLEGARVLDLYAGTGALAFEALSRGASSAVVVELASAPLAAMGANVRALDLADRVRVVAGSVERRAEVVLAAGPFDLVFADPPYARVADGSAVRAIASLVGRGVLAPGGVAVLEHGKAEESPSIDGLTLDESRRYGDTVLAFYTAAPAARA